MKDSRPRFPIRRFDVFAEFHRLKNQSLGMSPEVAKGRAIWAAKVVAGRRYGAAPSGKTTSTSKDSAKGKDQRQEDDDGFRSVGGELQTDKTFDKEIVDRMGAVFYNDVFSPAIEDAFKSGKSYEGIRDAIRKDWK